MEQIALVFVSPKCLEVYASENDFLNPECAKQIVSKLVSYFIMTFSIFVKLPQIVKVYKAQSGEGLNNMSLLIETTGFMGHFTYCYVSSYPFSIYGDAICSFLQTLLIFYMKLDFSGQRIKAVSWFVFYISAAMFLCSGTLSLQAIRYFNHFGFSIMGFGGLSQIFTNFRTKSTGQISAVSMMMAFTICFLRVLTVLQESNDKGLAVGAGLACVIIGVIIMQIKLYEKPKEKVEKKKL
ncbi:mannose-P-dolichol utilization defect 1 protein homolog [Symsagittifera roscoffensis]|uniref:mannose-P-dolichol utilization defect 1 protein homolog n=1 Tax=Symsagittifera roscoffensis TaxID=84072 RepID=UPI00307C735F